MTDVFTKAKRSEVMSRIRGRGNKATELLLISIFRREGIKGWRRNQPVFGRPDFIFPGPKLAVFVDGCFWHSCPEHCRLPKTNRTFWTKKLTLNSTRDTLVTATLEARGWRVLRIWEHSLKYPGSFLPSIKAMLHSDPIHLQGSTVHRRTGLVK